MELSLAVSIVNDLRSDRPVAKSEVVHLQSYCDGNLGFRKLLSESCELEILEMEDLFIRALNPRPATRRMKLRC